MTSNRASRARLGGLMVAGLAVAARSAAQAPLGTFTWQVQPYCNVIVVTATAVGSSFRLEGLDDQCGAPQRAPLSGMATPNPDGTVSFAFRDVLVRRPLQARRHAVCPHARRRRCACANGTRASSACCISRSNAGGAEQHRWHR